MYESRWGGEGALSLEYTINTIYFRYPHSNGIGKWYIVLVDSIFLFTIYPTTMLLFCPRFFAGLIRSNR